MDKIKVVKFYYIKNEDIIAIDLNNVKNVKNVFFDLLEKSKKFSNKLDQNKKGELKGSKGELNYSKIPIECTYGLEITTRYEIICLILATWADSHGNPYIKMETLYNTFGLSKIKIIKAINKNGAQFCLSIVDIPGNEKGVSFLKGQYRTLFENKKILKEEESISNFYKLKDLIEIEIENLKISDEKHKERVYDFFKDNAYIMYYLLNPRMIIDEIINLQ